MTEFKPRKLQPKKDNENYYSKKNTEYPKWIDECTWYAQGRTLELGITSAEFRKMETSTNAENWYKDSKWDKRVLPELGDILVYSCGKRHHAADGMGHVAIVEEIREDNSIRITESGHNMKFQTRWVKYPYKYYLKTNGYTYTLDGFVHPQDFDNRYFKENKKYKAKISKYIRSSVGVSNNKVKYDDLTADLKALCYKTANGYAKLKVGSKVTPVEFRYDIKGYQWCRIYKYWVCNRDNTGYQLVKA